MGAYAVAGDAASGVEALKKKRGGQPMMRLARRASLLVAFSLLTSAATAYAECAWVLWEHMAVIRGGDTKSDPYRWRLRPIATETKAACDAEAKKAFAEDAASTDLPAGTTKKVEGDRIVYSDKGPTFISMSHYVCMPASFDPRGPMGGTR
jgi:hypothetical protein